MFVTTVINAGQAFVKSTTTGSAQNMTPVPPTPYLKKLPDLSPYVLRALGYTKPFFIDLPLAIGRYILLGVYLPIAYLFHTLLAILSPVWVLLEVTVGIFVVAPFNALSWLAGLMFPVYVFCGVAALVGALLGLMGVGIGNAGLYLVSGEAADTGSSYGGARETTLSEREGRVREAPIQIGAQRSRNDTLATTVTLEGGSRRGKRVEFID